MQFRVYTEQDEPTLRTMLAEEGIPVMLMQHDNPLLDTVVMEDKGNPVGFYSWNDQHGRAALIHYIVDRGHRSNQKARALIKHFITIITRLGYTGILVAIPNTNVKLFNFVKYYFKNPWVYKIEGPLMFVRAEV